MADLSILGQVDCCNVPIEASWIDYMWLASNTWELADTSVEAYAMSEYGAGYMTADFGAWNLVASDSVFSAPVGAITETWSAITEPFTSMYDSVASMLGTNIGTNLGIEAIKQQVVQWMGQWVASTFGEVAASTLLTATTTAGATTYSMAGSMLSSIITVVGIIYAIYQIAKMVVQLIFAYIEEETKLNMLKNQKLCTGPNEIGNYCSAEFFGSCVARREAYCCFSSPFARIFQQQARPQLDLTFGDPKAPTCDGLTINQIQTIDFNQMDFSEWIDMIIDSIRQHLLNKYVKQPSAYKKIRLNTIWTAGAEA